MKKLLDKIAENYGKEPGKMLIFTGAVGWILSSLAQAVAIATNDKITREQKMFLIPQELADAFVNIVSFVAITQTISSIGKKIVTSGKFLPEKVKNYLVKNGETIGTWDTNLKKVMNKEEIPSDIKKSYENFYAGTDVIATTIGTIISCNIVTPIIRNRIATRGQKDIMDKYQTRTNSTYPPPRINDYMNNSSSFRI